ncbi:MAG: hypothetical protein IKL38_02985 [Firmicutes bacterium]|nr:hypothetical protein [Bacillota bacterium]
MIDRVELTRKMQERVLGLGEILKASFQLLFERFGFFFLLMMLVYLPYNVATQISMLKVDLTSMDLEVLMSGVSDLGIVQLVLSCLELVAALVIAVIVHSLIFGREKIPFGTLFYRGVRGWLRAVMTMMVLMLGMMTCMLSMSMFMMMPGLSLMILPLVLVLAVVYSMMLSGGCTTAALRGYWGLRNVRYVSLVYRGYMWRVIGYTAVFMVITEGITLLLGVLLSFLLYYISNEGMALAINVGVSTLLSMFEIYASIAGSLLFLNIEEKKRREAEIMRQMKEQERQM